MSCLVFRALAMTSTCCNTRYNANLYSHFWLTRLSHHGLLVSHHLHELESRQRHHFFLRKPVLAHLAHTVCPIVQHHLQQLEFRQQHLFSAFPPPGKQHWVCRQASQRWCTNTGTLCCLGAGGGSLCTTTGSLGAASLGSRRYRRARCQHSRTRGGAARRPLQSTPYPTRIQGQRCGAKTLSATVPTPRTRRARGALSLAALRGTLAAHATSNT